LRSEDLDSEAVTKAGARLAFGFLSAALDALETSGDPKGLEVLQQISGSTGDSPQLASVIRNAQDRLQSVAGTRSAK
jgi:hypothetical protein